MVAKKTSTKATKPKTFSQALAKQLSSQGITADVLETIINLYQDNGKYSAQGLVSTLRYLSQGNGDFEGFLRETSKTYETKLNDFASDLASDEDVKEELLNSLS